MREHREKVEDLFNCEARSWNGRYEDGRGMHGRLALFRAAVGDADHANVLDFGCGTGDIAADLARRGSVVVGVDVSLPMLISARKVNRSLPVCAVDARGQLPFRDASFDTVVASSVIEYVGAELDTLGELARVLKPGGELVFSVPDTGHVARKVERIISLFFLMAPALVRRLLPGRARNYVEYLRLSINRHDLPVWSDLLQRVGLLGAVMDQPGANALIILKATKQQEDCGAADRRRPQGDQRRQ